MVDTSFFKNNGPFTLKQVAEIIESKVTQNCNLEDVVHDIAPMEHAGENEICFFYDRKAKEKAMNIKAKACVTKSELKDWIPYGVNILIVEDPKLAFLKLNKAMYEEYARNPQITRSRMYYEAISEILPGVKLYLNTGDSSGVDMLLPLETIVGGGK